MAAAEPIRDKQKLKEIAAYYLKRGQLRNYALVICGVNSALRISDLLRLKWEDVYDFEKKSFRSHIELTEKKTGKKKAVALNREVCAALRKYRAATQDAPGDFLFRSNRRNREAISRIQAYRIIRTAASAVGMPEHISCHSLRKTFGYHAWKSGVPVALIMDIYNHSSYQVTKRYLGVCQDDRDSVYLGMRLF